MNHRGIFRNNKYASRKVFSMRQHYGRPLRATHKRMAYKKTAGTVQIDIEDYMELLDDRLTQAEEWWGSTGLHDELLNFMELQDGTEVESPKVVADNFVVNGEFVEKDEFSENGNYSRLYEKYNGSWEDLCENEGIIYNDEVCCINLGF